eukprot:m.99207 g.99207  ORF g.99207 m.99207 type:complete len:1357 (+) comp12530_c0_seq17:114-4184(+)
MTTSLSLSSSVNNPKSALAYDGLLDSLVAIHEECKATSIKRLKPVTLFVEKYDEHVNTIKEKRPKIADFEKLQVIGRGAYGEVQLVRHKETKKLFALKKMSKSELLSKLDSAFYWEERDIMSNSDSPWIVKAQFAFQDKQYLYLAMEYLCGGDLINVMEKFEYIPEEWAKFYVAELVLALETLHNMGYIHRDVKPDNLLLDAHGHIKLADFGTCVKMGKDGLVHKPKAAVGTPDYISPEVLESQDGDTMYGRECDWWGLGVLLYELLYGGENPFYADSLLRMYSNIQNHKPENLKFPKDVEVSKQAKDFMKKLLVRRDKRIGRKDISKIKAHPFFKGVDWVNIRSSTAPYIPDLKDATDCTNFPEMEKRELPMQLFKQERTFAGNQLPFVGFTFSRTLHADHEKSLRISLDRSLNQSTATDDAQTLKVSRLEEELEKTKGKLRRVLTDNMQIREQLTAETEKIVLLEKKHNSAQERSEGIAQIEINDLKSKIDNLENAKEEQKEQHKQAIAEVEKKLQAEIAAREKIQSKLAQKKEEFDAIHEENKLLKQSTSSSNGDKEDLETKLLAANKSTKRLKAELEEMDSSLSVTTRKLKKSEQRIIELEDAIDDERKTRKDNEQKLLSATNEMKQLQSRLAVVEKERNEVDKKVRSLQLTISQNEIEIQEKLKTNSEESKEDGVENTSEELKRLRETNSNLIAQLEAREDEASSVRLEMKALTMKNQQLEKEMNEQVNAEVDELQQKTSHLKRQLKQTEEDLSDETFAKEELLKKIAVLKRDDQSKQAAIDDLIHEVDKSTSKTAALRSELERVAAESALKEKRLLSDFTALEKELEDSLATNESLGDQCKQKQAEVVDKTSQLEELRERLQEFESWKQKNVIEFKMEKENLTMELNAMKEKLSEKTQQLTNTFESNEKQVELLIASKNDIISEKDVLVQQIEHLEEELTSKLHEIERLNSNVFELSNSVQLERTQKEQALKLVATVPGATQQAPPKRHDVSRQQTQMKQKAKREYEAKLHAMKLANHKADEEHKQKIGELNEEYGRMIENIQKKMDKVTEEKENTITELRSKCDALEGTVSVLRKALESVEADEKVKMCLSPALKKHIDTANYGFQGWLSVPNKSKKKKWKMEFGVLDMEGIKLYENEEGPDIYEPVFTIKMDEIHSAMALPPTDPDFHADPEMIPLVFKVKAVIIDRSSVQLQAPTNPQMRKRASTTNFRMVQVAGHLFSKFKFQKADNHFCRICNKPLKGHMLKHVGMKCQVCGMTAHTKHFEEDGSPPHVHPCPGNISTKEYLFKAASQAEQHTWLSKIEQATRRRGELKSKMLSAPHRLSLDVVSIPVSPQASRKLSPTEEGEDV